MPILYILSNNDLRSTEQVSTQFFLGIDARYTHTGIIEMHVQGRIAQILISIYPLLQAALSECPEPPVLIPRNIISINANTTPQSL